MSRDFLVSGGTELACMSTSEDLNVVAGYASSDCPLFFRIKVQSCETETAAVTVSVSVSVTVTVSVSLCVSVCESEQQALGAHTE